VLAYHNIVPRGEKPVGERTLHLPQAAFAEQLDRLAEQFDVVPLIDAFAPDDHTRRRARIVITFDDAYAGAVEEGIDEVVRRGLTATIFVAPGRLDGHAFWWDRVAESFGGAIPSSLRRQALEEAGGIDARVMAMIPDAAPTEAIPPSARSAPAALVRDAASRPGITIGSHSWSHPNLARLSSEEVFIELERAKVWLETQVPGYVPWLAYPYGASSATVHGAMQRLGLAGGFLVNGGWSRRKSVTAVAAPRLTVPAQVTIEGFRLRLAGLVRG
jgi:peptidoglycan/xylan/chitin deacetylase (PgdA/CDA1 family)